MNERPAMKKTIPTDTATTPIEDFGERHWTTLLVFEERAVITPTSVPDCDTELHEAGEEWLKGMMKDRGKNGVIKGYEQTLSCALTRLAHERLAPRNAAEDPATLNDLLSAGFLNQSAPAERPIISLSDRGWDVSSLLRRWRGERRPLVDFVAVRCSACTRIRYGERRPCDCGGSK